MVRCRAGTYSRCRSQITVNQYDELPVPARPLIPILISAVSAVFGVPVTAANRPPNIVLIYFGCGDISNPVIRTPNIDQLAREGVRSADFNEVTSSCTPSRGALLTGRYPLRNGLTHNVTKRLTYVVSRPRRSSVFPPIVLHSVIDKQQAQLVDGQVKSGAITVRQNPVCDQLLVSLVTLFGVIGTEVVMLPGDNDSGLARGFMKRVAGSSPCSHSGSLQT